MYSWTVSLARLAIVVGVVVACSAAIGCGKKSAGPPDLSQGFGPAEDAVKTFFTAAEGGDCDGLRKVMLAPDAGPLGPEGCDDVTHDFKENKDRFRRVINSKADGRDKNVVLVTTEVEFETKKSGNLHQWVMRAEWRDGVWKVRF